MQVRVHNNAVLTVRVCHIVSDQDLVRVQNARERQRIGRAVRGSES